LRRTGERQAGNQTDHGSREKSLMRGHEMLLIWMRERGAVMSNREKLMVGKLRWRHGLALIQVNAPAGISTMLPKNSEAPRAAFWESELVDRVFVCGWIWHRGCAARSAMGAASGHSSLSRVHRLSANALHPAWKARRQPFA
jgi:hypothetical protein